MAKDIVVFVGGFFDPIHFNHILYLEEAKKLGTKLAVCVATDKQVKIKGSVPFMTEDERLAVVRAIHCVDFAFLSGDDDISVAKTLEMIRPNIFAKGGNRTIDTLPQQEIDACKKHGIEIICGICGNDASSSEIKNRLLKK